MQPEVPIRGWMGMGMLEYQEKAIFSSLPELLKNPPQVLSYYSLVT